MLCGLNSQGDHSRLLLKRERKYRIARSDCHILLASAQMTDKRVLLLPQRGHWIDMRGSSRWNLTRHRSRGGNQCDCHSDERWIAILCAGQDVTQHTYKR